MTKFILALGFAAVMALQGFTIVEAGGSVLRNHNYTTAHAVE
jgi:hypothetical protein